MTSSVRSCWEGISRYRCAIPTPWPRSRTFLPVSPRREVTLIESGPVARMFALNVAAVQGAGPDPPDLAAHGSGVAAICQLRDITAAWGAERIRSDFVANVSHELRSPLSVLIGFIETLKGPASGDHAALKRFLDIMDAESRRMARLVDDLLSLSRVESSEHVPPSGTVNVHDMISETCESFATRAAEKEITIEMELDADVGAIPGDRDELLEVLHNLVDNAIKYGRHKSVVRIDTRRESRIPETGVAGIAITVTNLGEVIASETSAAIDRKILSRRQGTVSISWRNRSGACDRQAHCQPSSWPPAHREHTGEGQRGHRVPAPGAPRVTGLWRPEQALADRNCSRIRSG